eukprot:snap_masked-scaffold_41-processed-gene-2.76-mRNA-1 protein AED:0.33 eAED:0.50 QI:0/-1/0/1/-1/1/1/0/464
MSGTDFTSKIYGLIGHTPPAPVLGSLDEKKEYAFAAVKKALEVLDLAEISDKLPKVVHVAGTKGKGSTCAMVESILRSGGLKTGLFTSPHLIKVNERIRLNGKCIQDQKLEKYFNEVYFPLEKAEALLGFYKFMTVLALHIFTKEDLDVVILEVGIGGLLDATNVVERKVSCGVTLLDFDHTEYLGTTMEEIAFQKAGIYTSGAKCYSIFQQNPVGLEILRNSASAAGEQLHVARPLEDDDLVVGLEGDHQRYNAGLAIELAREILTDKAEEEFKQIVKHGLREVRYPGRCQQVETGHLHFFLDGAHTSKSIAAACDWFDSKSSSDGKVVKNILIFNCAISKPVKEMFESLVSLLGKIKFDKVVFCAGESLKPTTKRRKSAKEILLGEEDETFLSESSWQETLAVVFTEMTKASNVNVDQITFSTNLQTVLTGLKASGESSRVFVTGSLLLVGDVLKDINFVVE